PGRVVDHESCDVAAWPRQAVNEACADRIDDGCEHDRDRAAFPLQRSGDWPRLREDHVGLRGYQLSRERLHLGAGRRITIIDVDVASLRPSEPFELLPKRLYLRIVVAREHPDAPDGAHLLRPRRERPCRRRAAKQRDELAPPHSITSSASEIRLSEILTPSDFAVLRFITNSNFVDCTTGKSAAFAPFRIRPT